MTQPFVDVEPSERVRIARAALEAAVAAPGVAGATAGTPSTVLTADPTGARVLRGVTVAATADGGFDVLLRLVAHPVPLVPLGADVRRRVLLAAGRAGLAGRLREVDVEFADVVLDAGAVA
jgi:hypothetical protein